jgi:hypothetical protein
MQIILYQGGKMFKRPLTIFVLLLNIVILLFGAVHPAIAGRGQLTSIEIEGLLHMREEEKLARDSYLTFYQIYGLNTFQMISNSEQHHMDAVKNLLDYYGLVDPASSQVGVFTNPDLQALYDQLNAWGRQSLQDALLAGAKIEEVDILDLEYYLSQTNKYNIQQVYSNLTNGSENHLRAFVSNLNSLFGVVYTPLYLSAERYLGIINGGGGGGGGSHHRGGR